MHASAPRARSPDDRSLRRKARPQANNCSRNSRPAQSDFVPQAQTRCPKNAAALQSRSARRAITGESPQARLMAQGESSNDSTMPGFNTARLSRPLLASSVVTVIPYRLAMAHADSPLRTVCVRALLRLEVWTLATAVVALPSSASAGGRDRPGRQRRQRTPVVLARSAPAHARRAALHGCWPLPD